MQAWDIEFRALSVGYGEHVVLRDINAVLPGGKVSVILGGSGCGKSTLLRHIIGLSRPLSGGVFIGGRDLFALNQAEFRRVRRQMGVLFQDGALLGALSLAQNVTLPLSEHLRLPKPLIREAALRVSGSVSSRKCTTRRTARAVRRHAQARGPGPGHHRRAAHSAL